MSKYSADRVHGGFSKPSKMPGSAWGIPARHCNVGSILREVKGSTCEKCYACKGMYYMPNVQAALDRRFELLQRTKQDLTFRHQFIDGFVEDLKGETHFRWHDSGDLQNAAHLILICQIASRSPWCMHYLPTREKKILQEHIRLGNHIPDNLCIRLSAAMVDGHPPEVPSLRIQTSTVSSKGVRTAIGFACPARTQGNKCGECRACWDRFYENIDYELH